MFSTINLRRFALALQAGSLMAYAFLRWDWLPETPEGRLAAWIAGVLIWALLAVIYIRPVQNDI